MLVAMVVANCTLFYNHNTHQKKTCTQHARTHARHSHTKNASLIAQQTFIRPHIRVHSPLTNYKHTQTKRITLNKGESRAAAGDAGCV